MAQPGVSSTLIGATSLKQLASNITASDLTLSDGQMMRLHEASAPAGGFSAALMSPMMRRMVFGGNDVTGWSE